MKIAVIDFSSTALSLLVADISGEMMVPVVGLRRSVSILGYMSKKGRISERGISKVVETIRYLIEAAEKVGAESVHLISTASMRLLCNYGEVSAAVTEATGLRIDNLDGQREAYADYIANREYAALGSSLLLDIGGYSSAIADFDNGDKESMFALDIGPAALFRKYKEMYPDKDEAKKLRRIISKAFAKADVYPGRQFARIILAGSNADALYSVYADRYSIPASSLRMMERKKLKKLIDYLVSSDDRSLILIRNAPEKVHMLIPSAILADETAKVFGAGELIVSDKGVKEGYLRLLVEESNV